jgi:hypothetical protein
LKLRALQRKVGSASIHVWPPRVWASSYKAGDKFAVGDVGVLTGVKRRDNRLSLTMRYDDREHTGGLEWDPPPALADVERVLKSNLGREIKTLGELDV